MRVVVAPVPGEVVRVLVHPNDDVTQGQILVEMQTFGMYQKIAAPAAGRVRLLLVEVGKQVAQGELLIELTV